MLRYEDIKDISDGRLYDLNDMVKADCQDCRNCHKCCSSDMGKSITLDPLDIYRLCQATGRSFNELLGREIELSYIDGIIIPNMLMKEGCRFLNEKGRCSIHPYRPSICRLFPLGRIYEGLDFKYFLQVNECIKSNRTKVKVRKWIDTPDIERYSAFVKKWHNFLKMVEKKAAAIEDETKLKGLLMAVIEEFYVKAFDPDKDFYEQFAERLKASLAVIRKFA